MRIVELELGEELGLLGLGDVEENSKDSVLTSVGLVPEVSFNISMISVDGMFRSNMEVNLFQEVGFSIVIENIGRVLINGERETTLGVDNLVGRCVPSSRPEGNWWTIFEE